MILWFPLGVSSKGQSIRSHTSSLTSIGWSSVCFFIEFPNTPWANVTTSQQNYQYRLPFWTSNTENISCFAFFRDWNAPISYRSAWTWGVVAAHRQRTVIVIKMAVFHLLFLRFTLEFSFCSLVKSRGICAISYILVYHVVAVLHNEDFSRAHPKAAWYRGLLYWAPQLPTRPVQIPSTVIRYPQNSTLQTSHKPFQDLILKGYDFKDRWMKWNAVKNHICQQMLSKCWW